MLPKVFAAAYEFLLDLVFPIECLGCGAEGAWICPTCLKTIGRFPPNKLATLKILGFKNIYVAVDYQHPLIAKSIHALKYKMVSDLAAPLAQLIIAQLGPKTFPAGSIFVPIPLHRARFLERGFNQSESLAAELAKHYDLPVAPKALARIKHTKPQMSLQRAARRQNIKHAFKLVAPTAVRGKNIFLVDDVLTTGATLYECAQALTAGRPKSINAIVIAHSVD